MTLPYGPSCATAWEECVLAKHTNKPAAAGDHGCSTLGELIHFAVRRAIEAAVEAELAATLGAGRYERHSRQGYQNGTKTRTLSRPTGALALTLPRVTMAMSTSREEWTCRGRHSLLVDIPNSRRSRTNPAHRKG